MTISVKTMRSRMIGHTMRLIRVGGCVLTLILTSTVHWPQIALVTEPVILEPMIETWPIDDLLNLWLNNAH